MCGIVGYIGKRDCASILLDGLRKLEYRGYDSAGIAVVQDGEIEVRRSSGKLANLEAQVRALPLHGTAGIGHTRWATHGRPSEENAHPHRAGDVVLVHNGIIENYMELRNELSRDGCVFLSETDTEVLSHLIHMERARRTGLLDAVRAALGRVRGSYAIAVMCLRDPGRIVVAKNSSPLIVGLGDGEMMVASDIPALLGFTRDMIAVEDGEIGEVTLTSYSAFSVATGQPLDRRPFRVDLTPAMAEKGGFKHFMLKEIHEQPRVFEDTIAGRVNLARGEVEFEELEDFPLDFERVVTVACGTACHAGMIGKMYLEDFVRLPVDVEYASEFRYRDPLLDERTLVLAISQSGETADTLRAVELAKQKGARVLAVCNVLGSSLTRLADWTVYTRAGIEIGVASTKAFLAQMTVLLLFSLFWGKRKRTLSLGTMESLLEEIPTLPRKMRTLLSQEENIHALAREFYLFKDFLYLGRGLYYPLALEGALKLKEISYIHAEGLAAGEMKHGPIALIEPDVASFVLVGQGERRLKVLGNIEEIKARRGKVIALCDEGDREVQEKADYVVEIPKTLEAFSPLLAIVPLQLFAYYVALEKGCDVDQPRNLAKSVTVE